MSRNVAGPVWSPPADARERAPLGRFAQRCADRYGIARDYPTLHRWSVDSPAEFWGEVADFTGLHFSSPPHAVYEPGEALFETRWFRGAQFNFAEQLLRGTDDETALIFRDERGRRRELSRGELRDTVLRLAAALQSAGIGPGDRVAAVLPNCAETVIVMLASATVGAVFSSCSPDFGVAAIVDRLGQIGPKALFYCDGYSYGGKRIECHEKFAAVVAALRGPAHQVMVPFLDDAAVVAVPQGATLFAEWLSAEPLGTWPQFPFAQPLFIMYSSGTTGKPKCIVHGAGGTLLQHLKEHQLHTGLEPGERLFYFTTCGWMMWNWLVSALASRAAIVLYDGSPLYPRAAALWELADEEAVSVFGTSPRFLRACADSATPVPHKVPGKLRMVLSTGAPLTADSFDYIAGRLGREIQLCSISGGTDIISCFVLGNALTPVWRGEIQGPGLGMAVAVYDEAGVARATGQGELVCTRPFPSMPLGFWNDPDGSRYRAAYFERFPGAWTQGDLAEWTAHGGMLIHGRADAVLNPGGVRIGGAEVCAPALQVAGVADALAVGQRCAGDERIVLFVVLKEGCPCDADLCARIRKAVRDSASPRHVPAVICAVPDLPRTLSGKTVELAVRAVLHDEEVVNIGALANPEVLEYFRNREELDDVQPSV